MSEIILPDENETGESEKNLRYTTAFCDPKYRRASWVAFVMGALQQFSGVNVVFFYSAQLFEGDPKHPES